jgi:hypothetical protein
MAHPGDRARRHDPVQRSVSSREAEWHGKRMDPRSFPAKQGRNARWSELEGDALAREVTSVVSSLEVTEGWRRFSAMRNLRRVDARPVAAWGLPPTEQGLDSGAILMGEIRLRIAKAMIETFVADVCGRQKPKPQFLTTGADWQIRRRAKKLDKFVYGVMLQEQGLYHDCWEAMTACVEDAMRWGSGALKIYAAPDRVRIDRVFTHDLYVDPQEARNGRPENLFQLIPYNRDILAAEFPEQADAIMTAARWTEPEAWFLDASSTVNGSRTADLIKVQEAWCLPKVIGTKSGDPAYIPGKHAIVAGGVCLHEEEWDRPYFPFAITRWSPDPTGFWGVGLVDEVAEVEAEVNEHCIRLQERERLLGNRRVYYIEGSIAAEHLESNEAEVHIPVRPGEQLPVAEKVDPLNDSDMQYLQLMRQLPFELCGISVQASTARKDPGITSGAAIRSVADIGSQRQAVRARRMWEQFAVEIGKRIVDATADLADRDPGFAVNFAGKGFIQEIKWSDVDLRRDEYRVQCAPASSLPQDPSGRLQTAQELFSAGLINASVFKRLLDWPDLESEQQRDGAEYDYVDWVIDRYLDASDADMEDPMFYQAPEGFFTDLLEVIGHVGQAYFIAKREGAPAENLALLQRYIEEAQELVKRKLSEQAAVAGPGGAPPGPPMAGMPGMPVGPEMGPA